MSYVFRYTYGKGVEGTAVATISNPGVTYWGWDSVARKRIEPRTIEMKNLAVSSLVIAVL